MNTYGEGSVATSGNETLFDDGRSATPMPGEGGSVLGVKKRKSGTFWRRKSNLNLLDQYDDTNGAGSNRTAKTNGHTNGQRNGDEDMIMGGTDDYAGYGNGGTNGVAAATNPRSVSPPPQLPAFIGGGGGLGLESENLFKDIKEHWL